MAKQFAVVLTLFLCFATSPAFRSLSSKKANLKEETGAKPNSSSGRILAIDGMQVVLVDRESKAILWRTLKLRGAGSLELLPNGEYLVAERKYLARIDKDGNLIARSRATFGFLTDIKRLDNDRMLISDQAAKTVAEVNWEGKVSWSIGSLRSPSEAVRLSNGNTLVADGSPILKEFDAEKKIVRSIRLRRDAFSIQLVAEGFMVGERRAVEFLDKSGGVTWTYELNSRVTSVQRISEDEYLISEPDDGKIEIITSGGYVKWELNGLSFPWQALYVG